MRVIIIADFAIPSGGAQRVAVESARALAEAGVDVTYLHAIAGADAALDHPGIERVCLGLADIWTRNPAAAALDGIWNREAGALAAQALAPHAGKPGVVAHLHQWTRGFSPAILPALRRAGLPTVITAHDYFLACPNGVLFRFDRMEPCELSPMSLSCVATNCDTRSYPHKLVRVARQAVTERQWAGWSVDVAHISDQARDRLAPLLPAGWRHHRIDNPIAVAQAAPVAIASGAAFAFVGRLTPEKGAVVAARAAAKAGAKMIFIGEGPSRAEIAAALPGAEITGWVEPADVAAILRSRARAVLAPSLWPETGPLTVLEAAAIGLPSIVSARCGASEHVSGATGVVAEPSIEGFADAMARLMDDGVASKMGLAAYETFWNHPPTPAAHATALMTLYEGIIAS